MKSYYEIDLEWEDEVLDEESDDYITVEKFTSATVMVVAQFFADDIDYAMVVKWEGDEPNIQTEEELCEMACEEHFNWRPDEPDDYEI